VQEEATWILRAFVGQTRIVPITITGVVDAASHTKVEGETPMLVGRCMEEEEEEEVEEEEVGMVVTTACWTVGGGRGGVDCEGVDLRVD
jgi:hypothetical protein